MKYGVISYEKKLLKLDGKDAQNIGDWLQMFAMEYLYAEWGITDPVHVSRNEASLYDKERCIVVVNGFNTCNDAPHISTKTFPLSPNIVPIFWSFHFHDRYIPAGLKAQLKEHEPIGCRDEETMCNLIQNGISAFVTGCVSALLPRRSKESADAADEIIFVDTPESLENYVPREYKDRRTVLKNVYPIDRTVGEPVMTEEESNVSCAFARERYEYYCKHAKLIVTSRLHVAAPAIAMGIPCILVSDYFDGRYSWIDKFLPLYSRDEFDKINWYPCSVEYEEQKVEMKNVLKRKVFGLSVEKTELASISNFYLERLKTEYSIALKRALKEFVYLPVDTRYAIWGTVTGKSSQLMYCIRDLYPDWKFVGIFDRAAKGNFEGYTIRSTTEIEDDENIVYFIMSKAIYEETKRTIKRGKYVLIDVARDAFEKNFDVK